MKLWQRRNRVLAFVIRALRSAMSTRNRMPGSRHQLGERALSSYSPSTAITPRGRTTARQPCQTALTSVLRAYLQARRASSEEFLLAARLLMTPLTERCQPHPYWRLVLVVGFLGGYTTFSSFEWETYAAVREGGFWIGLANVVGSVTLGYAAVWLGVLLGRR